jgi:hypothetical protein
MSNPIEKVVAKVAGKTAGIEARFNGLRGVFATLAEQHHEATSLLLGAESTNDYTKRSELWRQVRRALLSHEQAELLEIFPVLEGYEATRELARRHATHANELHQLIIHVDSLGVQSDAWRPSLQRLLAKVKEHAAEEEGEFFPKAQEALGEFRVKKLEAPFLRAQEIARARII